MPDFRRICSRSRRGTLMLKPTAPIQKTVEVSLDQPRGAMQIASSRVPLVIKHRE